MSSVLPSKTSDGWQPPQEETLPLLTTDCELIRETFQSHSLVLSDGSRIPLDTFIPPAQGNLLYSLVRHLRPLRTLEVGLANGISATHIAHALKDCGSGQHLAIDPFQHCDWNGAGLATLRRAKVDSWVHLDARPSHIALPDLEARGVRIQFAFVDGNHLFDYVMCDFLTIDRILDPGGMIAFDDSDWPAVNRVIRFALLNRHYRVFPTGIVIEPEWYAPRLATRLLRSLARRTSLLRRVFDSTFIVPSHELGIQGRCVVIQKVAGDDRNGQSKHFHRF